MSTSRRMRRTVTVGAVAVLAGGTVVLLQPAGALADKGGGARSVIFVVGDGMAAAHREAARLDQVGFDGDLVMNSLPVTGLQTTDPRDPEDTVTDSAAGATAWAIGQKTFNGAISVDVDGNPVTPLGTEAKEAGKATGIVTTAQVTDATPAAFFSSVADRSEQSEIARQYLEVSEPAVILGGGEDRWYPVGDEGVFPPGTDDPDDPEVSLAPTDLVAQAQDLGYEYVSSAEELASADSERLLGLFANEEMFQQRPEGEGDEYDPLVPLADMTTKALDVLQHDRDGFFLLVEEEAVDEMAHANNGIRTLQAMRALDETVQVTRDYVADHPDTLLIVVGDHETGGLANEDVDDTDESGDGTTISSEDGPFAVAGEEDKDFVIDWTTTGHTGSPTVVTAEGVGSDQLVGYYPNTHLHEVVSRVLFG
jgi:alkaline phosphatase